MGEEVAVFMDPSVVPVYKALLARADALDGLVKWPKDARDVQSAPLMALLAAEFRALAKELRDGA